jgi:ParB family chromosome partitioning protein
MKKQKGLGKGLSALIPDNDFLDTEISAEPKNVEVMRISNIEPNPDQPRTNFDAAKLAALSKSIEEYGVISPIIVRRNEKNRFYTITAGERRWRAAKLAGLKEVPVIIKDYNEKVTSEVALVENLQREDLNPLEEALAINELMKKFDLTQEEISEKIGKSRSAVANSLRLITLCDSVKKLIEQQEISAGHARALISVPHVDQVKIAETAVKEEISVRDVEKRVRDYFSPPEEKAKKKIKVELSAELKELIVDMQRVFGTKVNAIGNDKKGRIYIDYYTRDDLDRLSEILEFLKNNKK